MRKFGLVGLIISFVLFVFNPTSYAEQKINSDANQKLTREHVTQFIQWLNSVGSFEKISQKDISDHFANNFKYYVNGKLSATDANNLHERYLIAKNQYKFAYIHFPIKEILVDGNKAAAKYLVTFVDKNGIQKNTYNAVIMTFNKNGKVVEFSQSFDRGTPLPFN